MSRLKLIINSSMDNIYYIVYKVINDINGKFYIGTHKTKNINDDYMGSGKYLKYAQQKYGIEHFKKEILFIYDNPEEMYLKEAELVDIEFISMENTYNIKVGGCGGFDYINCMPQIMTENRISGHMARYEKMKDKLRKISSERMKKVAKDIGKLSSGFSNKNHTDESKQKIRTSMAGKQSGDKNSQFGTIWITDGTNSKKICSDEDIPIGWKRGRV